MQTRNWLLALVVLGIVGMHGLVAGASGTSGGHHAWAPATSAPSASVTVADHAVHGISASMSASPATPAGDTERESGSAALALCIWLLVGVALVAAAVRRTSWVVSLDRLAPRLALPTAPVLRQRTPVPRFTVMRC